MAPSPSPTVKPPVSPGPAALETPKKGKSVRRKGHEPVPVEEVVRRDLETRTHAVVDALYDLATRAADLESSAPLGESV